MLDTSLEGIQSSLKAVAKLNVGCSLTSPSLMATDGDSLEVSHSQGIMLIDVLDTVREEILNKSDLLL